MMMRYGSVCLMLLSSTAAASPLLTHTGRLLDAQGQPLNGTETVEVTLVDAEGAIALSESRSLELVDGYYAVVLGSGGTLDPADLLRPHEVVVSVGGVELGRQPLTAVPVAASVDGAVRITAAPECTSATEGAMSVVGGVLQVCDGSTYGAVSPPPQRAYFQGRAVTTTTRNRIATNYGGIGYGHIPWHQTQNTGGVISVEGTDILRFSTDGYVHIDYTQDIICSTTDYGVLQFTRYAVGSSTPVVFKNVLSEVEPNEWASVHGNAVLPVSAGEGIGFYVRCSGGSVKAIDESDWSLLTLLWEPR